MNEVNTVVIAGAGTMLGDKVLNRFAAYADHIILLDQTVQKLEELQQRHEGKKANIEFHCVNWSNRDEVENVFFEIYEQYGYVDVLISLLDLSFFGSPLDKINFFEAEEMMNLNFLCNLNLIGQCLPVMLEEDRGTIIILGEGISTHKNISNSVYRASKGALSIFWRELKKVCFGKKVQLALVHYNNPIQRQESTSMTNGLPLFGTPVEENLCLVNEQIAGMMESIGLRKHCKKINVVYVG